MGVVSAQLFLPQLKMSVSLDAPILDLVSNQTDARHTAGSA